MNDKEALKMDLRLQAADAMDRRCTAEFHRLGRLGFTGAEDEQLEAAGCHVIVEYIASKDRWVVSIQLDNRNMLFLSSPADQVRTYNADDDPFSGVTPSTAFVSNFGALVRADGD